MADVDDYISGKVLKDVKLAFFMFKFLKIPILGTGIRKKIDKKMRKFEPKLIDLEKAAEAIEGSMKCAVGERVCRTLFTGTDFTESVFLDELAEGLVKTGRARFVTKNEAIKALARYRNKPIIFSKVSGKHVELCRSDPANCVYWNVERRGMKCLVRERTPK